MRARTETLLGAAVVAGLMLGAALLGNANNRIGSSDLRASTFQAGPAGVRGLAEALERLGVEVTRVRRIPRRLADAHPGARQALVVLEPSVLPDDDDRDAMIDFVRAPRGGDLLLAGPTAEGVMSCFGYAVRRTVFDSTQAIPPGAVAGPESPWVHNEIVPARIDVSPRKRNRFSALRRCSAPSFTTVDTLLVGTGGDVIALRLRGGPRDRHVILMSDAELLRNRTMRRTDAGLFALMLFTGRYDRVLFDEFHHGFRAGGSLAGATWRWSLTSPFGWLVWQLAAVGVLALLAAGFRFGPARAGIVRTRRSHLEHVRALATALRAARGHDVAIGALVRGLRRRLGTASHTSREDWRVWLAAFDSTTTTPRARDAMGRLRAAATPGQSEQGVLAAANAMEDLWKELRP